MPDFPRITDAEWQVMSVVWDDHPVGAAEVARALAPERGWSARTVKTLLGRLVGKGALATERDGNRFLYSPLVSRGEGLAEQGRTVRERLREGETSPFLAHLLREAELGADEIAELRRVLDERERRR